jgi:hypothetical protein
MNPNFQELGELAFNPDGSHNLTIKSCLNCQFFKSYRIVFDSSDEPLVFGICEFPFMMIDETVGLGMVCDFYNYESLHTLKA